MIIMRPLHNVASEEVMQRSHYQDNSFKNYLHKLSIGLIAVTPLVTRNSYSLEISLPKLHSYRM